jgi:hypothetical protein
LFVYGAVIVGVGTQLAQNTGCGLLAYVIL